MILPPTAAHSLVDVIQYWAEHTPDAEVLRFHPSGEDDSIACTYADFDRRIKAIASQLSVYRGQRALLLYPSGVHFLEAFFACFYAGIVAVPAYPPRRNHNLDRLLSVMNDCTPALILSVDDVLEQSRALCEESFNETQQQLPWINTARIDSSGAAPFKIETPAADDLAFLQYTSGSTGTPKGVMLTHHNLITNVRMAHKAYKLPANARCVSWLPLFHDMGLIGAVMTPMYWGSGSVLMPPAAFLQKPLRWLQLLSEYGRKSPVGCTAPNFSYQMCVDTVSNEDLQQLDLSNWVFAMSGAEPVRAGTLESFAERFASTGFNADSFVPAFGMAESTLLSTCRHQGPVVTQSISGHDLTLGHFIEDPNSSQRFVSCGQSCDGQQMLIVDPDTREILSDHHVGELWLSGDHIAQGYWGQDALTRHTFAATTLDGQGPFMRTGDLAAMINGELYITGRLKDLLIIRGKNHYPQDIELSAAEAHPAVTLDHVAAFTIEDNDEEKLVLVAEVQRTCRKNFDADAAATAINTAIARKHGVEMQAITFIRFASLPKTSSGKIQRYLVKNQYLDGSLKSNGHWHKPAAPAQSSLPATPAIAMADACVIDIEGYIQQWLAAKLRVPVSEIPTESALDSLGLDSVDLVQLAGNLEAWLAKPMDNMLLWELPHIRAVAERLKILADETDETHEEADDNIEGCI